MTKNGMTLLAGLVFALTGCAGAPPMPTENTAIVQLTSQTGDQMMARTIDGENSKTFSYFRVTEGAHALEVAVSKRGPRDSYRQCYSSIAYDAFAGGQVYQLTERSLGSETWMRLTDNAGSILAQTRDVVCMPM
jgi:hypothetical protein